MNYILPQDQPFSLPKNNFGCESAGVRVCVWLSDRVSEWQCVVIDEFVCTQANAHLHNIHKGENYMEAESGFKNMTSDYGCSTRNYMFYVSFWVSPRRLNFICRRFETLCLFHLHRQVPICLWRWKRQSVPKRRHIKFRRRGITQKETYNIHNTTKVWNQEKLYLCSSEIFLKKINKPALKNEHITGDLVQITFVANVLRCSANMLLVCLWRHTRLRGKLC
jgi:hypothetical protein